MESTDREILILKQQFESHKESSSKELVELKKISNDQEKRIVELERNGTKVDIQYEQIMQILNKLNDTTIPNLTVQLEELKNKPVKRYETIVGGILGAIFGAVGGAIAGIFLKQ